MIEPIESADDPRLDPFRHVADPGWIRDRDLFVAEGRLVVERLIILGRFDIRSILVNRAAHAALRETLSAVQAPVLVCDDPTLQTITGYNFHRGCLALAARPAERPPGALFECRRVLALESVGNPDNIGGLFRTAAALGIDGVLLNRTSGDPLYRKAIRTSMGAVLRVPFARAHDWRSALAEFRGQGFKILALTPSPDAIALAAVPVPRGDERVIVMVGAEGPGLETTTLADADIRVRIPIDGEIDSLNVVVAAGIALERLRG